MSNCEHLIENAICCIERHGSFEDFCRSKVNKEMSKMEDVTLAQVWQMAIYVYYTYRPVYKNKIMKELEDEWGFSLDTSLLP